MDASMTLLLSILGFALFAALVVRGGIAFFNDFKKRGASTND